MAQRQRRILISAVCGIVAVAMFVFAITQGSKGTGPAAPPPPTAALPTTRVVVAAVGLVPGSKLTTANVQLQDYPNNLLPESKADYYTDTKSVIERYSAIKLSKGTLIQASDLIDTPAPAQSKPPLDLHPDNVAISIPFDEAKGFGGFIQPEDHIDILVDDGTNIRYGFQDVRVIKTGTASAPAGPGASPTMLVLELPQEKAAALAYVLKGGSGGGGVTIARYVLRQHDQYNKDLRGISGPANNGNWTSFLDG